MKTKNLLKKIVTLCLGLTMTFGAVTGIAERAQEAIAATGDIVGNFGSGKNSVTSPWSSNGLGSDYSTENYKTKVDTTGDYLQYKSDSELPEGEYNFTIVVKMIGGGNTSKFTVNGISSTSSLIDNLSSNTTNISGKQNDIVTVTATLTTTDSQNVYGFRFVFTKGSNVGLNSITITPPISTEFTLTYNGNGSTDGSVPTDNKKYTSSDSITVLGNTGNLVKDGYTFGGWNTKADGTGTTYNANGTFSISANTTLYAKWNPKTVTSISIKTAPTKVTYYAGTNFDPTGLVITATYNDATTADITYSNNNSNEFTFNPTTTNALTTSNNNVVITYGQQSVNQAITVNADSVKSLSWTNRGYTSGSTFEAGEVIKLTESTFKATWESGKEENVSQGTDSSNSVIVGVYDVSSGIDEITSNPIDGDYTVTSNDNGKYLVAYYKGKFSTSNYVLNVTNGPDITLTKDSGIITSTSNSNSGTTTFNQINYAFNGFYIYSSSYLALNKSSSSYLKNTTDYGKYISKIKITHRDSNSQNNTVITGSKNGTSFDATTKANSDLSSTYTFVEKSIYFKIANSGSQYSNFESIKIYLGDAIVYPEVSSVSIKCDNEIITSKSVSNYKLGSTISLTTSVTYTDSNNQGNGNVTWTSSNTAVATVNDGTVTLIGDGSTTITAISSEDQNKTATLSLTLSGGYAPHGTIASDPLSYIESITENGDFDSNSYYYVQAVIKSKVSGYAYDYRVGADSTSKTTELYNFSNKENYPNESSVFIIGYNILFKVIGSKLPLTTGTGSSDFISGVEVISVTSPAPIVTGVSISEESHTLVFGVNNSFTLTAEISGQYLTTTNVIWSTSDKNIATVTNGTVTAVGLGDCTIVATSPDDDTKFAICNVTVRNPQHTSAISLNKSALKLTVGGNSTLVATPNGDENGVEWSSSNTAVATVDNGVVTAVAKGGAIITVKSTYDQSITSQCFVSICENNNKNIELTKADFPTAYGGETAFENYKNVVFGNGGVFSGNNYFQLKKNDGYIRSTASCKLSKLTVTYASTYTQLSVYASINEITEIGELEKLSPSSQISSPTHIDEFDLSGFNYFYLYAEGSAIYMSKIEIEMNNTSDDTTIINNEALKDWTSGIVDISDENSIISLDENASMNSNLGLPVVSKPNEGNAEIIVKAKAGKLLTAVDMSLDKMTSATTFSFKYQLIEGGTWYDYVKTAKSSSPKKAFTPDDDTLVFDPGVYAVKAEVTNGSVVVNDVQVNAEAGKQLNVNATAELGFNYTSNGDTVTGVSDVKIYFSSDLPTNLQEEGFTYGFMLAKRSEIGKGTTIEEAFADNDLKDYVKVKKLNPAKNSYCVSLSFNNADLYYENYIAVFVAYNTTTGTYIFGNQIETSVAALAYDAIDNYESGSLVAQALNYLC